MSKVFISYRRDDSSGYAHAIYRELLQHFSKDRLFMDVDTVKPGVDFVRVIEEAVGECDVLVALIGKRWVGGEPGNTSRLENEKDYVRLEVSTALARDIHVIPVLVDGMTMPSEDILPVPLRPLTRRNALDITNTRFNFDVERVVTAVRKILDATEGRAKAVPSPWRRYGPVAAAVAVVLILFSFVFWWPKAQEAPVKEAQVQQEPISKEAPIIKPQPPVGEPTPDMATEADRPTLIEPGQEKKIPLSLDVGVRVEVMITRLIPDWNGFSGDKRAKELRVTICASAASGPCPSRQIGLLEAFSQELPAGSATIKVFNFETNPRITFTIHITQHWVDGLSNK